MIKMSCQKCEKEYEVKESRALKTKYCSQQCHNSVAGRIGGLAGKGVSRNTETKRPDLAERNKVIRYAGPMNGNWKGGDIGYSGLHLWIKKMLGRAKKCARCGSTHVVQWANISQQYKRDTTDWQELCQSCHLKYDRTETKHIQKRFNNHVEVETLSSDLIPF